MFKGNLQVLSPVKLHLVKVLAVVEVVAGAGAVAVLAELAVIQHKYKRVTQPSD
ncbi:hypothetical protein [Flexibacterium corallicola]|uniref:hypothetical protein n=1 Tax=Flexibacterium corallicola TaxID=3037259 RepID=UPI00286F19E0|nr:hypothetical protein [Pseudovibrio sp. M1P-2-3]